MTDTLVRADFNLAADIRLHLASKVSFNFEVGFDVFAQRNELLVREVLNAKIWADTGSRKDFIRAGTANAEDVGKCNL